MCFSAILGLGSSLIGASSASKAADAQKDVSEQQIALQREVYEDQQARFAPFYDSGTLAHNALMYEMGLGDAPMIGGTPLEIQTVTNTTGGTPDLAPPPASSNPNDFVTWEIQNNGREYVAPTETTSYLVGGQSFSSLADAEAYAAANATGATEYGGYTKTPGYDFRLGEGLAAIEAGVGARHGLNSGATLKALNEYGQDYASSEYGNYLNRLSGLTDMGMGAAGMTATAANNYAAGTSNALANYGNAASAGYIGVGNALSTGLGNLAGSWQYGKAQNTGNNATVFDSPWASSGFWG